MNSKIAFNVLIVLIIAGLIYYLYKIIQEPIIFEREKKVRTTAVINRLKDIRAAQIAYKDKYGKFSKDFNTLIAALKNDSFPEVKIIGNPDDTTQVVSYDTTYIPLYARASFEKNYPLDSLAIIPYSGGARFDMDAGEITKNNIRIQVFEASAKEPVYLKDLVEQFDKYIDDNAVLSVGSMTEGTICFCT
jgi:hypothetical protein